MRRIHCSGVMVAIATALSGLAAPARADLFRDIGIGLGYAGFNIEGDRNIALQPAGSFRATPGLTRPVQRVDDAS